MKETPGFIEVKIPKALLVLTREEYMRALRRGKYLKRSRSTESREKKGT